MKKLLLPILALLVFSCTGKPGSDKEKLIGKWHPVELSGMEMGEEEKKEILEKASIEFLNDGKYISRFVGEDETGAWTYDEKEKKLHSNPDGDHKDEAFTVGWSGDTLVLTNRQNEVIKMKKKKGQ